MGGLSRKLRAALIRLALVGEEWRERLAAVDLTPEDGWALTNAARLLARHPDPGWWAKSAVEARSG